MKTMSQQFTPYIEVTGEGDPIVFVHGGWTDGSRWNALATTFAATHTAVAYDRRGHSRSLWSQPVARRTDEDDLAQLIESLGLGPAHLVGNSYGGSIALGTAARYPDLVRSVAAHEPPLVRVAESTPSIAAEHGSVRTASPPRSPTVSGVVTSRLLSPASSTTPSSDRGHGRCCPLSSRR